MSGSGRGSQGLPIVDVYASDICIELRKQLLFEWQQQSRPIDVRRARLNLALFPEMLTNDDDEFRSNLQDTNEQADEKYEREFSTVTYAGTEKGPVVKKAGAVLAMMDVESQLASNR